MKVKVSIGNMMKELQHELDEGLDGLVTEAFFRAGEEAVKEARLHGNYMDRTGNLRSSINYGVYKNGQRVIVGQPQTFGDGASGAAEGTRLVEETGASSNADYALVVVAGMDYASEVENIYHKNVLTSAKDVAEAKLKEDLEGL